MNDIIALVFKYIRGMWPYKWSALLIAWMFALVGWMVVYTMPDQYKTNAVIYTDTRSILKPLLKGIAVDTDSFSEVDVVTKAIKSRNNIEALIREADLDLQVKTPLDKEKLISSVRARIGLTAKKSSRSDKNANVFDISYRGRSAEEVYRVVNLLVDGFIEDLLNWTRTDTTYAQEFLDDRIGEYERRLTMDEKRLADFKKKNVGLMPDETGGYYARVQNIVKEVENARIARRLAVNRKNEMRRQLKGEVPIITSAYQKGNTPASQVARYESELGDLLTRFTEHHPQVVTLKLKIKALKEGAASLSEPNALPVNDRDPTEINPVYHELKVELNRTEVEIANINIHLAANEKKMKDLRKLIDTIPQVEEDLSRLNRDYELTKKRYLSLVDRKESAWLAQRVDQNANEVKFRIIEPALKPLKPTKPNRALLITAVLGGSLLVGIGWSFLRFQMIPVINSLGDVKAISDFPILGVVRLREDAREVLKRKVYITLFLVGLSALFVLYIAVLIYRDIGLSMIQSYVSPDVIKGIIKDMIPI